MKIEDLLFFNKKGNPINMQWDQELKVWNSKMLFDKNSIDTYKSQVIYTFEKIEPSTNTFNTDLNKFQIFNTNDFNFLPKSKSIQLSITNIETVNSDVNFNTKWIYANDIELYFYVGGYCTFNNLENFHNQDFNNLINNDTNIHKVVYVEKDRIMVQTQTSNNVPISNIIPVQAIILPIDIIEVIQSQTDEPFYSETDIETKLYQNKKIVVNCNSVNDNIYTVINTTPIFDKYEYIYYSNTLVNSNDTLTLKIDFNLKDNSQLVNFDNLFEIEKSIVLDENNQPSLAYTYWTIVDEYKDLLFNLGIDISYNKNEQLLIIKGIYNNDYFSVDLAINNVSETVSQNLYNVIPIYVNNLLEEEYIKGELAIYYRQFEFSVIDNLGIRLLINGVEYNTNFDTDIEETITDWINEHAIKLNQIGIIVQQDNNILQIITEYPNVPIFIEPNFGSSTVYKVLYKQYLINNIKNQLTVTINGINYIEVFDTTDAQTVTNWVNTHLNTLLQLGIVVSNNNNQLNIDLLDPERELVIQFNIGSLLANDLSIYEDLVWLNSDSSNISGNEIEINGLNTDLNEFYSIGQKINIIGADKILQNKSYNIIGIVDNKLLLSYQGVYWNEEDVELTIKSDFFIKQPTSNFNGYLNWSFKQTETTDFFLYDFSGNQLKPYINGFPEYSGPQPLCGEHGEIELKLNKQPNKNINDINNPQKQQTIFEEIEHKLLNDNQISNIIEPEPIQTYIGYNALIEGWNKTRLYCEYIQDIDYTVQTQLNSNDLVIFNDDYLELQNLTTQINFTDLGFEKDQLIMIESRDITDNRQLVNSLNSGVLFRIKEVLPNKLIFTKSVKEETSIKQIQKTTLPFFDINGEPLFETRLLEIKIKVQPRVIAYFDLYGESEQKDERHFINLNNRKKDLIDMSAFYIFKEVDIKEQGIDWVFLNRKAKELVEIYPEIFNYLGSYKSVIRAINYFGYNDLTFAEYFQCIDPENKQFGKLFNLELLKIFDKNFSGFQYNNLSYENLQNIGFKKTNLFSLNYNITDTNGNFIGAYSLQEVKIKLLGLKKWLNDNIIPIGSKIFDITGKYKNQSNFNINHETYMVKSYKVEEYSYPVDFNIEIFKLPVTNGSNIYDISVQFNTKNSQVEWFEYTIKTFYIDKYTPTYTYYLIGDIVLHENQIFKAIENIGINEQPLTTNKWQISSIHELSTVQILKDYKWDLTGTSFTINENIDPYFLIETSWHSGYGTLHKASKSYFVSDFI